MPVGRIEFALSKLPVVSRVIERLDATRVENASLRSSLELLRHDPTATAEDWLRKNHAWILARAAPAGLSANGDRRIAMLISAFNYRSLNNWRPLCDALVQRGHAVYTALFPRLSDPDHKGLFDLPYPNLVTAEIDEQFRPIDGDLPGILSRLREAVVANSIDVIWMSTFHAGPEHHIREALHDLPRRPVMIGLQHGMAHDWRRFEEWIDKFDLFGTFGPRFHSRCGDRLRLRMMTCGLPKLDTFPRNKHPGPIRRILFAAQNEPPLEILKPFLHELSGLTKAEIVVRPHPECRDVYAGLFGDFVLDAPDRPIADAFRDVDAVITTGSTAGLESLASGLPTVVLPFCGGEEYEPAGIVLTKLDAREVIVIFQRFDHADFRAHVASFLDSVAGVAGTRTDLCVERVEHAASLKHWMEMPLTRLDRG